MMHTPERSQRANMRTSSWLAGEIVPDSEEERRSHQFIEISSDESDSNLLPESCLPPHTGRQNNPSISGATPTRSSNARLRVRRGRRIIESSSEGETNDEPNNANPRNAVIELSDSSPERSSPRRTTTGALNDGELQEAGISFADDAILTLDEPRSARRPFRLPGGARRPTRGSPPGEVIPDSQEITTFDISSDDESPIGEEAPGLASTPASRPRDAARRKPMPRTGRKAKEEAEQKQREIYARELYVELNNEVFQDGLPTDTKLNWNKRLLTTAGRAKYRKSGEGVITAEIELAQKILDCEERIRFTLAHEMCHLAAWIIDNKPTEGHGKIFHSWARKVMNMRPDIEISTKHNYEINYRFNWECIQCTKIYGRFSNSLKPDEYACGSCYGRLTPLFTTRARRTPGTPKMSRMAATTPNDSPLPVSRPGTVHQETAVAGGLDISGLTRAIQSVTLA